MKQLSAWASHNRTLTRVLIVLLYIPLNLLAIKFGRVIAETGLQFTLLWWYVAIFLTLLSAGLYSRKLSYRYRKTLDVTLGCCTFVFVAFTANNRAAEKRSLPTFTTAHAAVGVTAAEKSSNIIPKASASKKSFRKQARQLLFQQLKAARKKGDGKQVGLIILIVIAAIALWLLLAALSCSIICNGSEALGYALLGLGTAGIIIGAAALIRSIVRGRPAFKTKEN